MYDRTKVVVEASRGRLSLEPRGVDLVQALDWLQSRVVIYWQATELFEKVVDARSSHEAVSYEKLEESRQAVRDAIKELQIAARTVLDELSDPVAERRA